MWVMPPRDHEGTLQGSERIWGSLSSPLNSGKCPPAAAAALCVWFKAVYPVLTDNPFVFSSIPHLV